MSATGAERAEEVALLEQAIAGSREAFDQLLAGHRERLRRMISFRIDRQLQGRLDASDVLQEAFLEAFERFDDYVKTRKTTFFLWLRFLTRQRLVTLHRQHLGTRARDPRREVALGNGALEPLVTSASLAAALLGTLTSPSQAALRAELKAEVQAALNRLEPIDREVLALRHFEQLSNAEVAVELQITKAAASKRYIRAAERLGSVLVSIRKAGLGSR
jgi:RNA polymerase sigma-70 factor (ECF subfamily)